MFIFRKYNSGGRSGHTPEQRTRFFLWGVPELRKILEMTLSGEAPLYPTSKGDVSWLFWTWTSDWRGFCEAMRVNQSWARVMR